MQSSSATQLLLAAMTFTMALALVESHCPVFAQSAPQFEVASVKPSQQHVGPDYNNQFAFLPVGITARNVTLQRLLAEAFQLQLNQVLGPDWLERNEYDLQAQSAGPASKEQLALMLRNLLNERFHLKQHEESRNMRIYELVVAKGGLKIQPLKDDQMPSAGLGLNFHGNMHELANLIAIQLTFPALSNDPTRPVFAGGPQIPVLDNTDLSGIYDFVVDLKPETGADGFTMWQRLLQDQLGLKLESNRRDVPVLMIDVVTSIPTEN